MANAINTRIQLKYDSYTNWESVKDTFKPLKGELCIVNPGTNLSDAATVPCLMKVGDGEHFWKDLPWVSATAADVYSWAKQSGLFVDDTTATTTTSGDKTYTGNAITSAEWDASLNGGKGGVKFTKGAQFATKAELDAAVEAFGGDLSAITDTDTQYLFSTDGDKLVVKKVKYTNGAAGPEEEVGSYEFLTLDEVEALNYLVAADITTGTKKGTIAVEGTDVAVKGLGALAFIDSIDTGVLDIQGANAIKINNVSDNVTVSLALDNSDNVTLEQSETGLKANISDTTIAAVKVKNAENADEAAKVAHALTVGSKSFDGSAEIAITAADLGLSNALRFVGTSYPANPVAGDVVLDGNKEYVYDGSKWIELGDETSHALKTITITGTDGLEGGGTLEANREIKLTQATKDSLAKADSALQWIRVNDTSLDIATEKDPVDNSLSISVRIAGDSNNALRVGNDGLYVQDTIYMGGNGIEINDDDFISVNSVLEHVTQVGGDLARVVLDSGSAEEVRIFAGSEVNIDTDGIINLAPNYESTTAYYHNKEIAVVEEGNSNVLHAVASTGSIYDVAEGANASTGEDDAEGTEYLIFNCGSATTII